MTMNDASTGIHSAGGGNITLQSAQGVPEWCFSVPSLVRQITFAELKEHQEAKLAIAVELVSLSDAELVARYQVLGDVMEVNVWRVMEARAVVAQEMARRFSMAVREGKL
jgi:hypothetical protein